MVRGLIVTHESRSSHIRISYFNRETHTHTHCRIIGFVVADVLVGVVVSVFFSFELCTKRNHVTSRLLYFVVVIVGAAATNEIRIDFCRVFSFRLYYRFMLWYCDSVCFDALCMCGLSFRVECAHGNDSFSFNYKIEAKLHTQTHTTELFVILFRWCHVFAVALARIFLYAICSIESSVGYRVFFWRFYGYVFSVTGRDLLSVFQKKISSSQNNDNRFKWFYLTTQQQ